MFEKYPLGELKLIYSTLSQSIRKNPDLMDAELLQDLQRYLQKAAEEENYDVSLHADWENFLRGKPPA